MKARLLKNNLLVNMQWEPEYPDKLESGTLTWFRNSVKSNRKLFYTDAFGHVATGYTAKLSSRFDAFPIFLMTLFGDGIYYRHQANTNGDSYLVIIKDGRVVSGTDCFLKRTLFDALLENADNYSNLEMILITDNHLARVIEYCTARQQSLKRRRMIFILSFMAAGAVALFVLALMFRLMNAG